MCMWGGGGEQMPCCNSGTEGISYHEIIDELKEYNCLRNHIAKLLHEFHQKKKKKTHKKFKKGKNSLYVTVVSYFLNFNLLLI